VVPCNIRERTVKTSLQREHGDVDAIGESTLGVAGGMLDAANVYCGD
jgi:hypothetical protein